MYDSGTVTKVEKDFAWVVFQRNASCKSCGLCINGLDESTMILKVKTLPETKVGDHVNIQIDRHLRSLAQLWLLAMPIFALLATAFITSQIFGLSEGLCFVISVVALVMVFVAAWFGDKLTGWSKQPVAKIINLKGNLE